MLSTNFHNLGPESPGALQVPFSGGVNSDVIALKGNFYSTIHSLAQPPILKRKL